MRVQQRQNSQKNLASDDAANEPTRERKGLPTYTQVMEALLRDESIPNPLGEDIPLNIEISRVEYVDLTERVKVIGI